MDDPSAADGGAVYKLLDELQTADNCTMSLKLVTVVCAAWLLVFADAYGPVKNKDQYSVPEPTIEAFSPKGLRLSIPDSPKIKSVQFYLSFTKPIGDGDAGTIAKHIDDKQGSHWIYYNQNVALKPHDMIHFKIIVKDHKGLEWSRWGSYPIDKVVSLADNSVLTAECDEDGQQTAVFPDLTNLDASQSEVKSAYSTYKSLDTKPITRSTTTTTSGTFYVKPSGHVEASGYKSSSSFDSTRQDGDQWQHSKSSLTQADIDQLKAVHGQDFLSLPAFAHLNAANIGSGHSSAYHSSSYSSSSSSQGRPSYGSSVYHDQLGQTAETLPLVHQGPSTYSSYSKYEKKQSSQAVPSSVGYSSSDSFIQTPGSSVPFSRPDIDDSQTHIPVHIPSYAQSQQHERFPVVTELQPSYVQSKHYQKETVTTSSGGKPVITYPESSYQSAGASKVSEKFEYTAPKVVTVALPLQGPHYNGDVFRYPTRPTTPESCAAADYSYKTPSQIDVVALERSVKENQCLSVLAETITKAEVRVLKEANTELRARLQVLEQQFSAFSQKCQCHGY